MSAMHRGYGSRLRGGSGDRSRAASSWRLAVAGVNGIAASPRHQTRLVLRSAVAVNGARNVAEAVLDRQGDAGRAVLLQLGERNEDVTVVVGVVEIVSREQVAALRDREPVILLAAAQEVRVLELHLGARGRANEFVRLPASGDHVLLQRFSGFPRAFEQPDAGCPRQRQQMHRCGDHVGMSEGHLLDRNKARSNIRVASHVQLHSDGFALDEGADASDLVKHLPQSREHTRAVRVTAGQRNGRRRSVRGPDAATQQRGSSRGASAHD